MEPSERAAFIAAQAAMLNAEIAAAMAENACRMHRGESPAYDEKIMYDNIISKYESVLGYNACIAYLRG